MQKSYLMYKNIISIVSTTVMTKGAVLLLDLSKMEH